MIIFAWKNKRFLVTFSVQHALPRWGGGLEVSCPGRDSSLAPIAIAPVVVRGVNVCLKIQDRRNRIKP
jgi:hypothetical protein